MLLFCREGGCASFSNVRPESEHGMAFNRTCTSVYRIYVICMAFGRMPCKALYMLGLRPKPERGLCPLHPGRAVPAAILLSVAKYVRYLPRERYTPILFSLKVFGSFRAKPASMGSRGNPLCQKGFPRYHLLPSSPFPRIVLSAPTEGDGFFRRAFAVFAPSAMYNIRKRPRARLRRVKKRKDVPENEKKILRRSRTHGA